MDSADSILNCRICVAQGTTWQEIEIKTSELYKMPPILPEPPPIEQRHTGTVKSAKGGTGLNLERRHGLNAAASRRVEDKLAVRRRQTETVPRGIRHESHGQAPISLGCVPETTDMEGLVG